MLNRILEFIGMAAMFLGMCMCECDGTAFLIQLALVILGSLIAFIGYTRERLDYERRKVDKHIEDMKTIKVLYEKSFHGQRCRK